MSNASGVFALVKENQCAYFSTDYLTASNAVNTAIKKSQSADTRFEVSIDQSTTCTGICISNTESTFYALLDFQRLSTDKELYKVQLRKLVSELLKGLRVNLIVLEKPLNLKHSKATPVLRDLHKYIKNWKFDIPELYDAKMDSIPPHQWKVKVMDKSKGTGRTGNKAAIAEDICDKVPVVNGYRKRCPATDYDSFDALGILLGYKAQHYSKDGKLINFGSAVYNSNMHVFIKYLPKQLLYNKEAIKDTIPMKDDLPILQYNTEHSFYDNVKMCCGSYDYSSFIVNTPQILMNLLWETGESFRPDHGFVCIVVRQGAITKKNLEYAKEHNAYLFM